MLLSSTFHNEAMTDFARSRTNAALSPWISMPVVADWPVADWQAERMTRWILRRASCCSSMRLMV